MRKVSFALILFIILTSFLTSCGEDKKAESGSVTAGDRISAVSDFYSKNNLANWQDLAAVYLLKKNIADFNYADALLKTESYEDKCGMVISVSLLLRQKIDVSSYNIDGFVELIKNNIEKNYESMTIKQLALSVYAMVASKTDYDFEAAAASIYGRQNTDGGFPSSKDIKISDTESSAYALNIITLNKKYFTKECFEKVVTYLGNVINDDNTITDINGKKSATATSLVLNALISADLTPDGDMATNIAKAIDTNFKLSGGGYKKYVDDKSIDREANGEVMLCFAATGYGNIWSSIELFDSNTVSE